MQAVRSGHIVSLPGKAFVQIRVGVGFIFQTAHQPAAASGDFGRIEGQVLILRHLDRYGCKLAEPGVAAQRPAAASDPAEQLGLIPHADLAELNPCLENAGKILHQFTEINAPVCRKIKEHFAVVKCILRPDELHIQPALPDLLPADPVRLFFMFMVFPVAKIVLLCRHANDVLQGTRDLIFTDFRRRDDHRSVFDSPGRLDDHMIVITHLEAGGIKIIHLADISEFHSYNFRHYNSP